MADTSKLKIVDKYIFKELEKKYGEVLTRKKVEIGNTGIMKEFAGVSSDSKIIAITSHSSGLTSGGKSPGA
tara:strand:+ start:518 stop:730 length:213 start_codon:yes stop_codon:yes gene_type:complete